MAGRLAGRAARAAARRQDAARRVPVGRAAFRAALGARGAARNPRSGAVAAVAAAEANERLDFHAVSRMAQCRARAARRAGISSSGSKSGGSIQSIAARISVFVTASVTPPMGASLRPSSSSQNNSPMNRGNCVCATNTRASPISAVSSIKNRGTPTLHPRSSRRHAPREGGARLERQQVRAVVRQ